MSKFIPIYAPKIALNLLIPGTFLCQIALLFTIVSFYAHNFGFGIAYLIMFIFYVLSLIKDYRKVRDYLNNSQPK